MRSAVKTCGCLCLLVAFSLLALDDAASETTVACIEGQLGLLPSQIADSPRSANLSQDDKSCSSRAPVAGPAVAPPQLVKTYARLPLRFEANDGQTDREVAFLSRRPGHTLFLTPSEAVLALLRKDAAGDFSRQSSSALDGSGSAEQMKAAVVRMKLIDANPSPRIVGLEELPGTSNYFIGNDPQKWRTDIPSFARVKYEYVYPVVDLIYHCKQGWLEYDFVLVPGTNPETIGLDFEGVDRLEVDAQGDLVLHIAGGQIRQEKPRIYQEIDGERRSIAGGYRLLGDGQIGFQVAAYDARKVLIIDPVLSYSTYLGGSGFEDGTGTTVDTAGNAYVTGRTLSSNFPIVDAVNALEPAI